MKQQKSLFTFMGLFAVTDMIAPLAGLLPALNRCRKKRCTAGCLNNIDLRVHFFCFMPTLFTMISPFRKIAVSGV